MKTAIFSISILLILITVFSCAKCINKNNESPIIKVQKSNCFGKCKEYDLNIYEDGCMEYIGKRNVDMIGDHSSSINKGMYENLIQKFESNEFTSLDSTYFSGAKDLQKIKIVYRGKMVEFHKREAPPSLLAILTELDGLIESRDWQSVN